MNTKLTLTVDKGIIKKAKVFAKKNSQSLSQLVEKYFLNLIEIQEIDKIQDLPPITKELTGIIKANKDFDYKKEIQNYLVEKYIK